MRDAASSDLLGVLVSRVTGQPFETFLRERIFDPLGMNDTGFHVPADQVDLLPARYAPDPRTGEFTIWDEPEGGRWSRPRPSRAEAADWSPPQTTTTPTSACCSTTACTAASGSSPAPPSS
ncbi:serine hydrolase [Streptomyces longisporus]|uniref:Beta-lactamase-related domain-containing protein n=1 Tax=Streptomyces longisporus TaxID=1948 RepID=A0ABP6AST2_STRLO